MAVDRPDWSGGEVVTTEAPKSTGSHPDWPLAEPVETPKYLETEYPDMKAEIDEREAEIAAEVEAEERELVPVDGELPAQLIADWKADPAGETFRIAEAQSSALAVLEELDADDRQLAESGFHEMPEAAQTAILVELGLGGGGSCKSASEDELDTFAGSDEGAILVPFWRGKAGKNLGMVKQRLERIEAGMSNYERDAAWSWFDALPERAAIAAYCVLAS